MTTCHSGRAATECSWMRSMPGVHLPIISTTFQVPTSRSARCSWREFSVSTSTVTWRWWLTSIMSCHRVSIQCTATDTIHQAVSAITSESGSMIDKTSVGVSRRWVYSAVYGMERNCVLNAERLRMHSTHLSPVLCTAGWTTVTTCLRVFQPVIFNVCSQCSTLLCDSFPTHEVAVMSHPC